VPDVSIEDIEHFRIGVGVELAGPVGATRQHRGNVADSESLWMIVASARPVYISFPVRDDAKFP
jgi:hypothetical protein